MKKYLKIDQKYIKMPKFAYIYMKYKKLVKILQISKFFSNFEIFLENFENFFENFEKIFENFEKIFENF